MTLRNWKHEEFARLVAGGTDAKSAYGLAGFAAPDRRNHNRLLRDRGVAARIEELRRAREDAARAARVPINQVLATLDRRGICRVADFFERDAAGIPGSEISRTFRWRCRSPSCAWPARASASRSSRFEPEPTAFVLNRISVGFGR